MNNTLKRITLFVIAIPIFIALILFAPHFHYLWMCIGLTFIGVKCGMEMRAMMQEWTLPAWTVIFPGMAPILSWLISAGWIPVEMAVLTLTLSIIWAFSDAIVSTAKDLTLGIHRIGSRLIMVLYPGFFLWWIYRITDSSQAKYALLVFILIVFLNDSAAWLFGILLGRHRGLFAASPNKSLEGYIAGVSVTTGIIVAASYCFPSLFDFPLWQLIIFGILLGITIIVGDLVESAIKRATGKKDSGRIMLGRGGMLDSVDSLLFTAPLYYIFLKMGE